MPHLLLKIRPVHVLCLVLVAAGATACASWSATRPSASAAAPLSGTAAEVSQAGETEPDSSLPMLSASDLDSRIADLFGDALRVDASLHLPTDSDAIGGGDAAPNWDIEVESYETFDRVRHYVEAFTGDARDRFAERLSRGTRYEAMIRARLAAGGLPEDMYYLALVESGFNPHAYSSAAAVGLWQFMSSTARGMGLRVDWWIDERRDPVRSTDAAVRFLRGLNEQFGSLYLAAAAYNGGPGRIARGLTRYAEDLEGTSGDDLFFALAQKRYLRNETREYVPQLIAAALVAKEPKRYGLEIQQRDPFTYDSVRVRPGVALAAIADASATTVQLIQDLNPQILRGMTPPRDSVLVRIPYGARSRFDSAFSQMAADSVRGVRRVVTKKGATWASLARGTGVPARALPIYNPKIKPSRASGRIAAGTPVLIPTVAAVAAALPVPDPSIERYGSGTRIHVVRRGENLSVIAKRYHTTPTTLMRINRLKKALIFPGQELLVKGSARTRAKKATARKR